MLLLLAFEDFVKRASILRRMDLVSRLDKVLGEGGMLLVIRSSTTFDFFLRAPFRENYLTRCLLFVVGIET